MSPRFRTSLALLALAGTAILVSAGCSDCCCPCMPSPSGTPASASPAAAAPAELAGQSLFDGSTLGKWASVDFGGEGAVKVENGSLRVEMGASVSGVKWGGEVPRTNYEVSLDAMKVDGSDFFCGIVFPVGKETCSFVAGGWGGGVTGLSSVDHMNASENDTSSDQSYSKNQWYHIRLRVSPAKIEAWIDQKQVINLDLANRQISVHPAVEAAAPLGLTNYQTTSLFRNIRLKKLP